MCRTAANAEPDTSSRVQSRAGSSDIIQGIWSLVVLAGVAYFGWTYVVPAFFPRTTTATAEEVNASGASPLESISISASDTGGLGTLVIVKGRIRNNFKTSDYACYAGNFLLVGESSIQPDTSVSGCGSTEVAPGTSTNFTMAFLANPKESYKLRVETNYNQYITIPVEPTSK
jgi:hypothetical protein